MIEHSITSSNEEKEYIEWVREHIRPESQEGYIEYGLSEIRKKNQGKLY